MILTPDGYQKLAGSSSTEQTYRAELESLRTVLKSHSLIFIGFSLRDAKFLEELVRLSETYDGAASQHYAVLPKADGQRQDLKRAGVEVIAYEELEQLEEIVTDMAVHAQQSSATYVQAQRYLVGKRDFLRTMTPALLTDGLRIEGGI